MSSGGASDESLSPEEQGRLEYLSIEQYRAKFGRDPGLPRGDELRLERPTAVAVMAEYGGVFLWDRSPDPSLGRGALDPTQLGVTHDLVERLSDWNADWEEVAYSNRGFPSPELHRAWLQRGLDLARELQSQLPDVEVLYHHGPLGERRVRDRTDPPTDEHRG